MPSAHPFPFVRRGLWLPAVAAALALAAGCTPATEFNRTGLEAYGSGDYGRARAAFEEAIDRAPDVGTYYYNAGMSEQALGRLTQAIHLYEMATTLDPSIVRAYRNLATCHEARGQDERALAALVEGTETNPFTARAFINVADYYLARDDLRSARLWLAKAVAADPENVDAHREYGVLLIRLGEEAKGKEHLRRAVRLPPRPMPGEGGAAAVESP